MLVCLLVLAFAASPSHAQSNSSGPNATTEPARVRVFLIGNSLTADTLPVLLGKDVEWHIDCGKNLQYIFDHPKEPCVKSSVIWPEALGSTQYDVLCVQPHFGSDLKQDVAVISHWLDLQPKAKLVIHTGWNRAKHFEAIYHAKIDHQRMVHAPQYFAQLTAQLQEKYPEREIKSTSAIDVLDSIYHDIQAGKAPFKSFEELYRDEIHMAHHSGRYLAHNLMRIALNKPLSQQGFQIEDNHKTYLDQKLAEFQAQMQEAQSAQP